MGRSIIMEIQEAYKRFGLTEEASDEAIEKQFMLWIRKNKADPSIDLDSITIAYETIKNYRAYGADGPNHSSTFKDKVGHFFTYYKLHVIGVIALLAVLIGIGNTLWNNYQQRLYLASLPPENVEMMFYGSYLHSTLSADEDAELMLEANIIEMMPSWERVITTIHAINGADTTDVGAQQKSAVILATEQPDMYIMDLESFERYVGSGMFAPLDEISEQISEEQWHSATAEEDTTEYVYGLEVANNPTFTGVTVDENSTKIAAVRRDAENKENALELIQEMAAGM
ncbi:hypothetical protein [Shouchella patagoniensis]|uniref:hypothetical protein n=1 Tax=Shouchella patagoniensis TaxID=228576 RepID=UPI000994DCD4|nr:hypothetical protein [Shouchella patagoniensis]